MLWLNDPDFLTWIKKELVLDFKKVQQQEKNSDLKKVQQQEKNSKIRLHYTNYWILAAFISNAEMSFLNLLKGAYEQWVIRYEFFRTIEKNWPALAQSFKGCLKQGAQASAWSQAQRCMDGDEPGNMAHVAHQATPGPTQSSML